MKIPIITVVGGAVLIGVLATRNPASSQMTDQKFDIGSPTVVVPGDTPTPDTDVVSADIVGTVLKVGPALLLIEDTAMEPVPVVVPETARVTRNGLEAELSDVRPGDMARIDVAIGSVPVTATEVEATKIR